MTTPKVCPLLTIAFRKLTMCKREGCQAWYSYHDIEGCALGGERAMRVVSIMSSPARLTDDV